MPQIDLVIFDCDGVLLDSEIISCECATDALRSVGLNIEVETAFWRFAGISRSEMAKQVAAEGYSIGQDFAEKLEQSILDSFEHRLQSVPGVDRALSRLPMQCCVASGSSLAYIRKGLQLTGLDHFFEPYLFSASMVLYGKPAPDLFLYAAQRMNVAPSRCLVIEDSIPGIKAAHAADMPVFWFMGGSRINFGKLPPDFASVHPAQTFESMPNLPELISSFCQITA